MKAKVHLFQRTLICLLVLISRGAQSQIVIDAGALLNTAKDTEIVIQTSSDINNSSSFDFSTALARVELNGASQSLTGNMVLTGLKLNGTGVKTMNNNITVTKRLDFTKGYIKPSTPSAKFLFIGPADGITGGSDSSYFDCTGGSAFYSDGDDARFYPIGLQTGSATEPKNLYTPATINSITAETGMSVIANLPALSITDYDTAQISSINLEHYWSILPDASTVSGTVELSLNGLDLTSLGSTTIVQAPATTGFKNLGASSATNSSVLSRLPATENILAIGKEKSITVKIHDLITPSGSEGVNDKLYIENIDQFDYATVTLLDRWGLHIHRWTKDKASMNVNSSLADYDFNKLGPGSYIVVVEYGNTGEGRSVVKQMVTVLKTN